MPRSLRFRLRHALLLSVLGVLGAGAAGPALGAQTPDAWPQVGGDPSHAATASTPGPPYRRAWTTQIAGGGAAAGPVVAGETIVVVGWDRVVALRLSDGGQTWSVEREPGPAGPPAVVEEQVIHAEGLGRLGAVVALSLEDGSEVWRHDVGTAIVGGITVVPDGAIVGGRDGSIRLLDPETGDERWARDLPGRIETTPASDGRAIFVLTESLREGTATLHALDPASGRSRWAFTPEGLGATASSPSIAGGNVVASFADHLRAIDPRTGRERWSRRLRGAASPRLIPAAPGDVIAGDLSLSPGRILGHVYRVDARTGAERWVYRLPGDLLRASPVVAGGAVVVGDASGRVSAIDLDRGTLVWREDIGDGRVTAPAIAGGRIVLALHGGGVTALEADPGGTLLDEPSPTTLFVGSALVGYAAVAVPLFLVLLMVGRALRRSERDGPGDTIDEGPR